MAQFSSHGEGKVTQPKGQLLGSRSDQRLEKTATDGAQIQLRSIVPTNRIGQIAIPAAIVGIVVMMVVPLPTELLDLLLVTNIALATLALLASMFTTRVLDFSIFP